VDLNQFIVEIHAVGKPIDTRFVTGRGLHGLLYNIVRSSDPSNATKLHQLKAPKPFTLAPCTKDNKGYLSGIRLTCLDSFTSSVIPNGIMYALKNSLVFQLGKQKFRLSAIHYITGTTFEYLLSQHPCNQVGLRFLSPTSFKKGTVTLPLPIPQNVFLRPFSVWNTFAPNRMNISNKWLDWCEEYVHIQQMNISTSFLSLSTKKSNGIIGYIGDVWFKSKSNHLENLQTLNRLANFAVYCGIGYRTTMGGGVIEII